MFTTGEIHIHLIDRGTFHYRRQLAHTFVKFFRYAAILVVMSVNKNEIGAQFLRPCSRHCRMNAELSCFVRSRSDYTALSSTPADDNRFTDKLRIFYALN